MMGCTLSPEVEREIRRRASEGGEKISRVVDALLRSGLGWPVSEPEDVTA